jgi:hypothetical protein
MSLNKTTPGSSLLLTPEVCKFAQKVDHHWPAIVLGLEAARLRVHNKATGLTVTGTLLEAHGLNRWDGREAAKKLQSMPELFTVEVSQGKSTTIQATEQCVLWLYYDAQPTTSPTPALGFEDEELHDWDLQPGADTATNPSHYSMGGIQAIEYMRAKSTPEEFRGHLRLTCLKYLSRGPWKGAALEDYRKARQYLDWLVDELETQHV